MSVVYLLHFDRPISPNHTCQHYIGYATRLGERLTVHRKGHGARLTQVALERAIGFTCVRTWHGRGRSFERKLKNRKSANDLCPICQGKPVKTRIR